MGLTNEPATSETQPLVMRIAPPPEARILTFIPVLLRREVEGVLGKQPEMDINLKDVDGNVLCEVTLPGVEATVLPLVAATLKAKRYSVEGHGDEAARP